MRSAPLAVTEEALRILRTTRADFSRINLSAIAGRGSAVGSPALGQYDFEQVRNQGEYLRLVSVVEAYVDACSSQQFDLRTSGKDLFVRTLADEVRKGSLRDWNQRAAAFKTYHGVALTQCARWSEVDAAREVRNCVAHGLGRLTPRQQTGAIRGKIQRAGVTLRGDTILIDASALEQCVRVGVAFIVDIDRRIKLRH